ncbi:MAG: hypothetical protein PHU31_05010 [Anaerotignum sp.]|nr:hypothetical protein [Anaerotignum sp.]
MFLLALGSETAQQIKEIPQVLPLFLGFLLAMFLLNLGMSFLSKKAARDKKKEPDGPEKK